MSELHSNLPMLTPEWVEHHPPMSAPRGVLWVCSESAERSDFATGLEAQGWDVDAVEEPAVTLSFCSELVVWQVDAESDHPGESVHVEALRALQVILMTRPRHLVVMTHGASDSLSRSSPAQRTAWGLARTLRSEHPGMLVSVIDVESHDEPAHADVVMFGRLLAAPATTLEQCVRDGRAYTRRIASLEAPHPKPLAAGGTFLVVGSAPFFSMVRPWLLGRGADAVLHVVTRADPPSPDQIVVRENTRAAVEQALLARGIRDSVSGIYYADTPSDCVHFDQLGANEVSETFKHGILLLRAVDQATRHAPTMREFVAIADLGCVTGGPRRSASAMAAAYLEGIVERRRMLGRPANFVVLGHCQARGNSCEELHQALDAAHGLNLAWLGFAIPVAPTQSKNTDDDWTPLPWAPSALDSLLPWGDVVAIAAAACSCPGGPVEWAKRVTRVQVNMHRVGVDQPLKARASRANRRTGGVEVVRCTLASRDGETVGDVEISFDVTD